MQRAVICKGDSTSHGGKVLEGREAMRIAGRPMAQLGSATYCPLCKGRFPIIEGVPHHTHCGVGTAVEGMRTACGATLIAGQNFVFIDDGGGSGGGDSAPPPTAAPEPAKQYSGSFRAIDASSGQPVAGLPYRIELPGGGVLRGVTDTDGCTQRVTSHDPATVTLHWESEAPPGSGE